MRGIDHELVGMGLVPPFQGGMDISRFVFLGLRAVRFTPGYNIRGFQP